MDKIEIKGIKQRSKQTNIIDELASMSHKQPGEKVEEKVEEKKSLLSEKTKESSEVTET